MDPSLGSFSEFFASIRIVRRKAGSHGMDESANIKKPDIFSGIAEAHAIDDRYVRSWLQGIQLRVICGQTDCICRRPLDSIVSQRGIDSPECLNLPYALVI